MKKFFLYAYIIIFCMLISVIGVLTLLGTHPIDLKKFKQIEKRNPTPVPEWWWPADSVERYFMGLDAHINDYFALRKVMVDAYSAILYTVGSSANPGRIIVGSDDYLFLGNSFHQIVDHTEGNLLFSDDELNQWVNKFKYRKEYLAQLEIPFYMVAVPSKHVMYPEALPAYVVPSITRNITQIMDDDHDLNLIYLKDTLDKAKETWNELLYNKTDSHWSEIGAYISYLRIINWLKNDFENLEAIQLDVDDFEIRPHPGWQNKHLLGLPLALDDYRVLVNWESTGWDTTLIKTNYQGDTLPFRYNQKIEYHEKAIVHNNGKPYTLLLLEDSFSIRLSPYINQSFGKIVYCHYSADEALELTRLVSIFKPDLVLYEFGEQSLFLHRNAHPNVIADVNKNNLSVIKAWDGEKLHDEIISYNQIENSFGNSDGLHLTASGSDPFFLLPVSEISSGKHLQINVEITSPEATTFQVFYLTRDSQSYSETNSVMKHIREGRNKISFYLSLSNLVNQPFRFDPGTKPVSYTIHTIAFLQDDL